MTADKFAYTKLSYLESLLIKVSSGLNALQNKILTQNFCKTFNFKTEDNVPAGKLKKYEKKFNFLNP